MEGLRRAPYLPALAVLLSVVLGVYGLLHYLPGHLARAAQSENGPIENATVLLYLVGAVLACVFGKKGLWGKGYTGGFALFLLALRELDFHTRFTAKTLTQGNFLISARVPPGEKIIGLVVYIIVAALLVRLIAASRPLFSAVRNRRPYAISTFSGILLIPISILLDKTARILDKRGEADAFLTCQLFEEAFELAIPLLFVIALLQWKKEARAYAALALPRGTIETQRGTSFTLKS